MDELYEELQVFIRALQIFNESTAKNWDELQRAWDYAAELWTNDDARRQFESEWSEMAVALRMYRDQHGKKYEDFLMQRKWALDRYYGRS